MTRLALILRAVFTMHAWADRNEADWPERADAIAQVIAAQTNADAGILMAIMRPESGTLRSAHAGGAKYRGLWQLARCAVDTDDDWARVAGLDLDSTRHSAEAALRVYHDKLRGCRGSVACAMARYGGARHNPRRAKVRHGGSRDIPRWAKARARDAKVFTNKLIESEEGSGC